MKAIAASRHSFSVPRNGSYDVVLKFALPITDEQAAAAVQEVYVSEPGVPIRAEFRFSWRLDESNQPRPPRMTNRIIGTISYGQGGLGAPPYSALGFRLASRQLKAATMYTLTFEPEPSFAPLLKANPIVAVEHGLRP